MTVKPLRYGGQRVARPDRIAAGRLMETNQGIGVCLLDDHRGPDGDLGGRGRVRGGDKRAREKPGSITRAVNAQKGAKLWAKKEQAKKEQGHGPARYFIPVEP